MEYGKKLSVGGFNYLKFKRDEMSFIKVSALMGNWAMEWREDTLMYHTLDADITDEERQAVQIAVVNAFMCGSFLDADFQHGVLVAAGELKKRMMADAPVVSEEEDAEILSQLKTEHEMMDALEEELKNKQEVQAEV